MHCFTTGRRRRRSKHGNKAACIGDRQAAADNFYSIRCEPGGVARHGDSKTPTSTTIDENGYEEIAMPRTTAGTRPQSNADARPRIARRPPLPIDRRSLWTQGTASGTTGLGRGPSRYSSLSGAGGVNGVDADVRQLIDEVHPLAVIRYCKKDWRRTWRRKLSIIMFLR